MPSFQRKKLFLKLPWCADHIHWDIPRRKKYDLNYASVDATVKLFWEVYRLLLCHDKDCKGYIFGSTLFTDLNDKMLSLQNFSSNFHDALMTSIKIFLQGKLLFWIARNPEIIVFCCLPWCHGKNWKHDMLVAIRQKSQK